MLFVSIKTTRTEYISTDKYALRALIARVARYWPGGVFFSKENFLKYNESAAGARGPRLTT